MRRMVLVTHNLDLQPAHVANACPQSLGNRLLRRKSRRQRCSPTATLSLFIVRIYSRDKPPTMIADRIVNTLDLYEVNAR